jgi:hypothetical protein
MRILTVTAAFWAMAAPVCAQNFTTQAEVQPILTMTRANWVAVGRVMEQDWLYFTHLLAWRCGLAELRYGVNGAEPMTAFPMEPCYKEMLTPNEIRDLPYAVFPMDAISSVTVELIYPDGQRDRETYERAAISLD